ncbi:MULTISPECIES: hypothetical protein [Actinoalloteichus]|uniref:Uncharacterized protein n=1 Tax=Actinoalloteichus fjordicus TaxID=1612552 RepID=A0AAC9L6U4_9PSEU|nr:MULTISPECIES: hypothetical protein [Actinoalloteichus]APU12237.1 hypothetical protein UA74_00690 [Actinoalloteichus fjordicus]APU18189.1 hypothetical protein UA75_00690 [Actinoalloteichus sp. GBA129-24]
MSTPGQALILHPVNGSGPLTIAVSDDAAQALRTRLVELVQNGATEAVPTQDGGEIIVNFAQLVTAHLSALGRGTAAYGRPAKTD